MGLKLWLKLVPVFSLSKQQTSEPGVKSVCPTGQRYEQKAEEGWVGCGSQGEQQVIQCSF